MCSRARPRCSTAVACRAPGGADQQEAVVRDYRQITGSIGNMGQKEMGFDFSGPLDEEKRIAYRLRPVGLGHPVRSRQEERYAIAPTLASTSAMTPP